MPPCLSIPLFFYNDKQNDFFDASYSLDITTKYGFKNSLIHYEKDELEKYEDTILFKHKRNSKRYLHLDTNNLYDLKNVYQKHLYEVIQTDKHRRLFFDIDMRKENIFLSYNDIINITNYFKDFLINYYKLPNEFELKYRIHISNIQSKFNYSLDEKIFNSIHIFFNVYTHTHIEAKEIVSKFCKKNYKNTKYIDLSVYSSNRLFRTLYQSKENEFDKTTNTYTEARKDRLYPIGIIDNQVVNLNNITFDDFATLINNDCFLLKSTEIKKYVSSGFNITYNINETTKLTNYLTSLTPYQYEINSDWKKVLYLVVWVYYVSGKAKEDILNDNNVKYFLLRSRVGEFNTNESEQKNKDYITKLINLEKLKLHTNNKFFERLDDDEIDFIYKSLHLLSIDNVVISTKTYNQKLYIHIQTEHQKALYLQNTQLLLIDYVKTKQGKNVIISSDNQMFLSLHKILKNEINEIEYLPHIQVNKITDLNDVVITPCQSTYIQAPVGSGKSWKVMSKDIKAILSIPNTKILMTTDTITLTKKQFTDISKIFEELNIPINQLLNYQDYKKQNLNNVRFIITCYDSIEKFENYNCSHFLIDEFVNVIKRTFRVSKINNDKIKLFKIFSKFLTNTILKLYDADFIFNYQNIFTKPITLYKLENFKQPIHTAIFTNEKYCEEMLIEDIKNKKNVVCIFTSKKKMFEFQRKLYELFKQIEVLLIYDKGASDKNDSETDKKNERELKNVVIRDTTTWEKYQVVCYTPTIQTGISFDNPSYFYRTYCFLCEGTTDAEQSCQMLFRVRNNIMNEMFICVLNDRIKSVVYKQILTMNDINVNSNKNFEIIQEVKYKIKNIEYITLADLNKLFAKTDEFNINVAEEYQQNKQQILVYDIFLKLKEWGVDNFIVRYKPLTETIQKQLINAEDKDEYMNKIAIDENVFCLTDYVKDVSFLDEYDDNDKLLIEKFWVLHNFNISNVLWENSVLYTDNKKLVDKIICMYQYNKNNFYFKKLGNISYYIFREAIYFMYDNCFPKYKTKTDYLKDAEKFNADKKFLCFILTHSIVFKTFELINLDFIMLEELYLNEKTIEDGKETYKKIQIDKKFKSQLELMYKEYNWIYQYIIDNTIDKKIENTFFNFYNYCFSQLGFRFQINQNQKYFSFTLQTEKALNYRISQPIVNKKTFPTQPSIDDEGEIDVDVELNYTINEFDDMCYWKNIELGVLQKVENDNIDKKSELLVEYEIYPFMNTPINYLPKINLFNVGNKKTLNKYYDLFCDANVKNEFNKLLDVKIIEIDYNDIKPIEKYNNLQIKPVDKEQKKQETKDKRETQIICECGGTYWVKDVKRHIATKKHQKHILSN